MSVLDDQVITSKNTNQIVNNSYSILNKYKSHRFEIPPNHFFQNISHDEYWTPEFITPWYYLDSYHHLDEFVKRRYNQLYALAINEIFTVLENEMLVPILKKLSNRFKAETDFYRCLVAFYEEEEKHSKMFDLLNRTAEPRFYNTTVDNQYYLCRRASVNSINLVKLMSHFPDFLSAWLWFTIYFEERTIIYSKAYLKKDQVHINKVFKEVHKLHLLEELYHVELDEVIVDRFYKNKSPINRNFAAFVFKKLLNSFSAPKRMSFGLAHILITEFPQNKGQIQSCLNELPQLKSNSEYQKIYFSQSSFPKTRKLMSQFPEFNCDEFYYI